MQRIDESDESDLDEHQDGIVYRDLSYLIMGAVFEVHGVLGPGFGEGVYEEALALELGARGIPYERQVVIPVHYKGRHVGTHRLDLVVEGKVLLELKAVQGLDDDCIRRLRSYLKSTGLRLAILINFGRSRVEHKRIPS